MMKSLRRIAGLASSGFSTGNYYSVMNKALKKLDNSYTMLHYPYHKDDGDSFIQAQTNLTDFCLSHFDSLENKKILDIGCGNGVQTIYILSKYNPGSITGVDLNQSNILIANSEKDKNGLTKILFEIDDAQNLKTIPDQSIDVVINIESAFHYPDKPAFINEVSRVLKPGGQFLIADILTSRIASKKRNLWKKRMVLHHWPLINYEQHLSAARLEIVQQINITREVIKGFKNYRQWIKNRQKTKFISGLAFRLFYMINASLNIYLLQNRRMYYVIVGAKPVNHFPPV